VRVYDPALAVVAGQTLTLGKEDDEWPGWVWCTPTGGPSGWLPIHKLTQNADGLTATANVDYDTRELAVNPGETVTVLVQELGWSFCQNAAGDRGWIPDTCLA
jgi:hypothetical protein